jgi:hypothetical protein
MIIWMNLADILLSEISHAYMILLTWQIFVKLVEAGTKSMIVGDKGLVGERAMLLFNGLKISTVSQE